MVSTHPGIAARAAEYEPAMVDNPFPKRRVMVFPRPAQAGRAACGVEIGIAHGGCRRPDKRGVR
jgi:hypothetical protein